MRVNRGNAWQSARKGRPAASGRPFPLSSRAGEVRTGEYCH